MADPIIEKIRKLLRIKRGGTEDEIATALRFARELASKHGIDLGSVDPNVETGPAPAITHMDEIMGSRLAHEAKFAVGICVNHFNVEVILRKDWNRELRMINLITFVGTEWDIAVAKYVFEFLRLHFRKSWTNRQNRRLRDRDAFLYGMYVGLTTKLHRSKTVPTEEGLVAVDQALALRKSYLNEHWPNSTDSELDKSDSKAAQRAGFQAGRNTEIRSALSQSESPAPLQLTG